MKALTALLVVATLSACASHPTRHSKDYLIRHAVHASLECRVVIDGAPALIACDPEDEELARKLTSAR